MQKNTRGWTPLYRAAWQGHHRVVQLLLAAGADVNAAVSSSYQDVGCTALHEAAMQGYFKPDGGYLEMVQLLLRHGANPQLREFRGRTPLYLAAQWGQKDVVRVLLAAWGKPQISSHDLLSAVKVALRYHSAAPWPMFAVLAKELQKLYPAEVQQLLEDTSELQAPVTAAEALAAALDEWASASKEQRVAMRKEQQNLDLQKQAVQQLVVGVAGLAQAQQDLGDDAADNGLQERTGSS
jgi:hypothetical protein